ncbi:MAG: hypothetical protein Q4A32_05065 [Lachnospiraceae bacterium]|nr:hypothetical protein [Lachnospiraceae bacterium]
MNRKLVAAIISMMLALSCSACGGSSTSAGPNAASEEKTAPDNEIVYEDLSEADKDEGKTSTVQMESTVVDETLTCMLKPLDAIMVVEYVTSLGYVPDDPVIYWSIMYYYLCLYGPRASGASYDEKEEYLVVGADIVREAGRVLFGETVSMPEIPDTIARISLHDDGNYYVKNDPRPDCYPEFVSAVKNSDGSYEAIAQLTDVHGNILINHSFHLAPKSTVNNLLGIQYYYTVNTAGVG